MQQGAEPKYDDLDQLIQFSNIANDEHDFGNALQLGQPGRACSQCSTLVTRLYLGMNLFAFSPSFTNDAVNLLLPTYDLLQR